MGGFFANRLLPSCPHLEVDHGSRSLPRREPRRRRVSALTDTAKPKRQRALGRCRQRPSPRTAEAHSARQYGITKRLESMASCHKTRRPCKPRLPEARWPRPALIKWKTAMRITRMSWTAYFQSPHDVRSGGKMPPCDRPFYPFYTNPGPGRASSTSLKRSRRNPTPTLDE